MRHHRQTGAKTHRDLAADQIRNGERHTLVWNMHHLRVGHRLKQSSCQMTRSANACGHIGQLFGPRFRQRNQFAHILRWHRWVQRQHHRTRTGQRQRREILDRIKRQFFVEAGVDGMPARNQRDRIAVGRGTRRQLGADDAIGTGTVFDDYLLLHGLDHFLRHCTTNTIVATAGRKDRDNADRLRRVAALRRRG